MKAIEYLEEQKFGYDHFTKLTSTGINPDNINIAQFAEDYHQAKLNLLTIPVVSKSFAVGVEVEITDCIKGHEFEIGEKVTIVEYDDNMWICRNKKGIEWYINEDEGNVC